MRPELEDFDELNAMDASPRSRAMSWLVLCVAVGGFAALAYYAYHSGSQSMRDSTLTVVNAEDAPIKSAPADAGGEQFPNKDKTIYDAISANGGTSPHVEKLLPEAEQPVIVPESVQNQAPAPTPEAPPAKIVKKDATTFVNAAAKPAAAEGANARVVDAKPAPVTSAQAPAASVSTTVKTSAPVTAVASASIDAEDADTPVAASASAPAMVNVKPATATSRPTSEIKDANANAAANPGIKTVSGKTKAGAYKVQLGAFKSEAEARAQWKKISAKYSHVLSGEPIIVKADLPNGTFYRLRAAGFASGDAAKAACAMLEAGHQPCFPAGK